MRIMIFGRPGSGKSTFALQLSHLTGLPLYHLDRYFYVRNWVERDYQEFMAIQRDLVARDAWIIDGNNTKSFEVRYQRADIAIYFCYPRLHALYRVIKRRLFKKTQGLDDRAEGCAETVQWSLINYLWTYEARVQQQLKLLQHNYPHVEFYTVGHDQELKALEEKLIKRVRL